MKIIVTGAAGFIGSHLTEYLAKQGHDLVAIDDMSMGFESNLPRMKNIVVRKVDLAMPNQAQHIIEQYKPDILYHLAAYAHEGLSQFTPKLITRNNLQAYVNTLVAAIKAGVKRVVLTSSMAVYGNQPAPFAEYMDTKPVDIYGINKEAMEKMTQVLSKVHGFEYVIIRPHNVYGPRQNLSDPYRNVAGIFINSLLRKKKFYVYGDGEQRRSFSYIDDVTPALAAAGFVDTKYGNIYNIGPVKDVSINDLAGIVCDAFSLPRSWHTLDDRPQEVKEAFCTNDRAIKYLGYQSTVTLEEGIKRMVEWAKELGPQEPKYLDELELPAFNTPITWLQKLI